MKNIKRSFTLTLLILSLSITVRSYAQTHDMGIDHVEPTFWWTGMRNKQLQIMVHGKDIAKAGISVTYPGVEYEKTVRVENPDYVFIYLKIEKSAKPGDIPIIFTKGGHHYTYSYQLHARNTSKDRNQGFNSSDVIYLLMPDRFSDGNTSDDNMPGMLEKADRSNPNGRHGGDIQGIENHLDYLKDLGVTTLWMTPLVENNMPTWYHAYHGYAATNLYKIDPRFGTNQDYVNLVSDVHKKGMKVILDIVLNHIGSNHWWMKDLPTKDWVHSYKKYGNTNYRAVAASDPYASQYDKNKMEKGWFVKAMPDLNQSNPLEATYLIQNTIWWVEYSGVDGIRVDTYPYPNKEFTAKWEQAVQRQFPNLNIVGEVFVPDVGVASYWQENTRNRDGYDSHLPGLLDFPLREAIIDAFTKPFGWHTGVMQIYYTLAQDFLYSNPMDHVIFFDNHDTERFGGLIKKDKDFYKMALAFLMTTRGIPQLYYGTEIMMSSLKNGSDGNVRKDFPGGWPNDPHDAFKKSGRTLLQNEIFDYTRKLIHFRDQSSAIDSGHLMQFIPQNNVYVYFRYDKKETIMVIMNLNDKKQELGTSRFAERMNGFTSAENVMSGEMLTNLSTINVPAKTALILKLGK